MSSSSSQNTLQTITRTCSLAPRLIGGSADPLPTVTIAKGDLLPWDPSARSLSDLISIAGCLTYFTSHPSAASHVEWMCPEPSGSLSPGFVLQVRPVKTAADGVPLTIFSSPNPGNSTNCSTGSTSDTLIPWPPHCASCLDSGSPPNLNKSINSPGWLLHGCMSVIQDGSSRTSCSWVDIPQGSTCLPAISKYLNRILTCRDDAAFISEHLNPNIAAAAGRGRNGERLEKSSTVIAASASSGSSGGSWMVIVGAASACVLVLILLVVYTYRRCIRDSAAKPATHSSPLLPYHRPANLGKPNLTRPIPTRNHSPSSSACSSLVHVPADPSDALHERFDSTLSKLAILHTARSPAAQFSSLGLLLVPLPDIDHLPSPDLYLTTSLASLTRDWDAIFHRLEYKCAQIIVANHREWPSAAAGAAAATHHVNFAQYHMQRAQLMAHTMGHIWRVLVLGSSAPNALVDALVADMREVFVKVAAVFPTVELVGTRAGSEFRADAMCGYGVSGVGRETMLTEEMASGVGGQEGVGTVVKEMVWPGWMDVGKAEVMVKARVIV